MSDFESPNEYEGEAERLSKKGKYAACFILTAMGATALYALSIMLHDRRGAEPTNGSEAAVEQTNHSSSDAGLALLGLSMVGAGGVIAYKEGSRLLKSSSMQESSITSVYTPCAVQTPDNEWPSYSHDTVMRLYGNLEFARVTNSLVWNGDELL